MGESPLPMLLVHVFGLARNCLVKSTGVLPAPRHRQITTGY
jgi:hypothetical protein